MKAKWELTGKDANDIKANMGEHDMLRVERLDKGIWWFCVYIGKDDYMSGERFPHVGTKEVAKQMAEGIYTLIKRLQK